MCADDVLSGKPYVEHPVSDLEIVGNVLAIGGHYVKLYGLTGVLIDLKNALDEPGDPEDE